MDAVLLLDPAFSLATKEAAPTTLYNNNGRDDDGVHNPWAPALLSCTRGTVTVQALRVITADFDLNFQKLLLHVWVQNRHSFRFV